MNVALNVSKFEIRGLLKIIIEFGILDYGIFSDSLTSNFVKFKFQLI